MEYRYKLGDRVRVIDKIEMGKTHYMHSGPYSDSAAGTITICTSFQERKNFAGKVVTIKGYRFGNYIVDEDPAMLWVDDMFVGWDKTKIRCKSLL